MASLSIAHARTIVPATPVTRAFGGPKTGAPVAVPHERTELGAPPLLPATVVQAFPMPPLDQPLPDGKHLPAFPKDGSKVQRAELAAMHVLQDTRTPDGIAWAQHMAKDGATRLWLDEAKQAVAIANLHGLKNEALVAATLGAAALASGEEKHDFQRTRPFVFDPTLTPVVARPAGTSYPSGHAAAAFAAATMLATINPAGAAHYADLAAQVAYSRVYAGVHYPTDVLAGAALGVAVGQTMVRAFHVGR